MKNESDGCNNVNEAYSCYFVRLSLEKGSYMLFLFSIQKQKLNQYYYLFN